MQVHLAMVLGDIIPEKESLIRVHMTDPLTDLLNSTREPSHWPLPKVMNEIQQAGNGVLVILRQPQHNRKIAARIAHYQQQDLGKVHTKTKPTWDSRTFGVGAQILSNLGVKKMRVMGTPKKLTSLSGFGLELIGYFKDVS